MKKAIEIILKLIFDVGAWFWSTCLLSKGLGFDFNRTACLTLGVFVLHISMRPWAKS